MGYEFKQEKDPAREKQNQEIWEAWQRGEIPRAILLIQTLYIDEIRQWMSPVLRDPDLVERAIEELWVRLTALPPVFQEKRFLLTWLSAMSTSVAKEMVRSPGARSTSNLGSFSASRIDIVGSVVGLVGRSALGTLSQDFRLAISSPSSFSFINDSERVATNQRRVMDRLQELTRLPYGWMEGEGIPVDTAHASWLGGILAELMITHRLPEPALFPLVDGGVQAVWRQLPWRVEAEFDLANRWVSLIAVTVNSQEDDDTDLDLSQESERRELVDFLRKYLQPSPKGQP